MTGSPSLLPRTQIAQNRDGKCRVSVATNIFRARCRTRSPRFATQGCSSPSCSAPGAGGPARRGARARVAERVPRAWWAPSLLLLLLLARRRSPECWCSLGWLLAGAAPLLCPLPGPPAFSSTSHQCQDGHLRHRHSTLRSCLGPWRLRLCVVAPVPAVRLGPSEPRAGTPWGGSGGSQTIPLPLRAAGPPEHGGKDNPGSSRSSSRSSLAWSPNTQPPGIHAETPGPAQRGLQSQVPSATRSHPWLGQLRPESPSASDSPQIKAFPGQGTQQTPWNGQSCPGMAGMAAASPGPAADPNQKAGNLTALPTPSHPGNTRKGHGANAGTASTASGTETLVGCSTGHAPPARTKGPPDPRPGILRRNPSSGSLRPPSPSLGKDPTTTRHHSKHPSASKAPSPTRSSCPCERQRWNPAGYFYPERSRLGKKKNPSRAGAALGAIWRAKGAGALPAEAARSSLVAQSYPRRPRKPPAKW